MAALLLKAEMNLWCYGLPVISTCSYLANYSTELLTCGFVHTKTADYFRGKCVNMISAHVSCFMSASLGDTEGQRRSEKIMCEIPRVLIYS